MPRKKKEVKRRTKRIEHQATEEVMANNGERTDNRRLRRHNRFAVTATQGEVATWSISQFPVKKRRAFVAIARMNGVTARDFLVQLVDEALTTHFGAPRG